MKTNDELRQIAQKVMETEIEALQAVAGRIDTVFAEAVRLLFSAKGKIIVTGVGKSAIIAQKMVATFNSTGTTAVFLHAADAIHGDLGIIRDEDVVVLLSKSGETPELKVLIPLLKVRKNKLIAIVGNTASYLANQAELTLDTTVSREACPNNLAPTSSTTAQLVMGDALAVALLECRGFTTSDFARVHPGGVLGKQLLLCVKDVFTKNETPQVLPDDDLTRVIIEISQKRLGATAVIENGKLAGIITDGDLRRMLMTNPRLDGITAKNIMTENPKSIQPEALLIQALEMMRQHNITQLPVVENGYYKGVIHLHDILKEGIL